MSLFNAIEHRQVKRLATKDHLTALDNRAAFDEAIAKMMSVAKRNHHSFTVLALDLNKFKAVNDTYGHLQGDQILMAFAQVLNRCIRDSDQAFRFGGDEFCCLLLESEQQNIDLIVERIHKEVANDPLLQKYSVSSSIGHACFMQNDTVESVFERADKNLYADKKDKSMKAAS
jgi:diguanylate cyclase (GGDEF)-like protein